MLNFTLFDTIKIVVFFSFLRYNDKRIGDLMKVCVIGGAGYIGSHTVYELIRAGHEVVVIDNLSSGKREMVHKEAKFYFGDITDKNILDQIFVVECQKKPFDVVMHFAAKLIVPESLEQPLEYYKNNVEGVRTMLEVMVSHNIKNVVFSSTAAVYGEVGGDGVCTEDAETKPINPYGETKLASEQMIKWVCKAYDMHYCIFRYFNVGGADESLEIGLDKDNITALIPRIVESTLRIKDNFTIYGTDYDTEDGTCIRDYVHVTDLAKAHILGAEYIINNRQSLLCNLGSNNGYSVQEVVNKAGKLKEFKYNYGPKRAGDPAKVIASNTKAKELLGWKPKYDLDDMLKSDYDFRKKLKNEKK